MDISIMQRMNLTLSIDRYINISKAGSYFLNFANQTYIIAVPRKG